MFKVYNVIIKYLDLPIFTFFIFWSMKFITKFGRIKQYFNKNSTNTGAKKNKGREKGSRKNSSVSDVSFRSGERDGLTTKAASVPDR